MPADSSRLWASATSTAVKRNRTHQNARLNFVSFPAIGKPDRRDSFTSGIPNQILQKIVGMFLHPATQDQIVRAIAVSANPSVAN